MYSGKLLTSGNLLSTSIVHTTLPKETAYAIHRSSVICQIRIIAEAMDRNGLTHF